MAAQRGLVDISTAAIERKVDVDAVGGSQCRPLHLAAIGDEAKAINDV